MAYRGRGFNFVSYTNDADAEINAIRPLAPWTVPPAAAAHPATSAARLDTLATVAANSQALPLGCQACHLGLGPSEQQTLARSD